MEKRGITQELPEKDDLPDYVKDYQDELSERVIKQIKQADRKEVKNGSTITRTDIAD